MGDPNCYYCSDCLDNCYTCPNGSSTYDCRINAIRRKRINKQSRMSSSLGLLKRRSLIVSKLVGQGAKPQHLLTTGGPGDLAAAMQKSNYPKAVGRAACYNMGRLRNRTAYKNNQGVDQQKLDKAIKTTRFDFLKKKENESGFKEAMFSRKKDKKIPFFNNGFDTSWKNHLKENIVEKIEKEFMNEMKEVGYL